MRNKIFNTFLVIVSLIFSLYIIELLVFFLITNNHFNNNLNVFKYDKRSRAEIFYEMKKENPDITIALYPYIFLKEKNQKILPLSSFSKKKTIFCNENGYYAIYNSDRYGFNNPDDIWDKQQIDYFIVGDSFAQGMCVNESDTFSGNIKRITGKNVLNLGMSGNGPIRELATLKEYMPIKKVKTVLWFYFEGNDLADIDEEMSNKILLNYFKDNTFTQDLKNKQKLIDSLLSNKLSNKLKEDYETRKVINYSYYIRFMKLYSLREFINSRISTKNSNQPNINSIKKLKEILKLSKDFIEREHEAKLYFIYLPTYIRYADSGKNNNDQLFLYGEVKNIIKELNIELIDINSDVMKGSKTPLSFFPFGMSGHYSVEGYRRISEHISEITKNKF